MKFNVNFYQEIMGLTLCLFTFMQFIFPLVFFNFTIANFTAAPSTVPLCHDDERSALLQFKESLTITSDAWNYPCHPKAASWNGEEGNNIDCCSWDGVKCNENTGHVIKLDLSSSCLHGSINSSSSIFHLVHLEWLNLAYNDFRISEIPSGIINLSRLSYLNLSFSYFTGQIPSEILDLPNMVSLDLSENSDLQLQKPSLENLVEKLTNLKELHLGKVTIASPVPHNLANLSSLTFLSVSNCKLQGIIPSSIGNLTELVLLDLSFNELTGELPTSIGNLRSLKMLDVSSCKFSGQIPSSLGNLSQLERLYLVSNNFSGEFSASIGNLKSLEVMVISFCKFSGRIPSSLSNLIQLKYLDLSHNNFSGTMDLDLILINLKELQYLNLISNRLSLLTKATSKTTSQKFTFVKLQSCNLTEFPNFLKNQHHLEVLDLSSNRIHGKVPVWLLNPSMQNFIFLNLSHNFLTGFDQHPVVLPLSNRSLTVDLSYNYLEGPLPVPPPNTWIYQVSNNNLKGVIPSWICDLNILEILDLSHNSLSSFLPQCLGNFSYRLSVLDFHGNNFFGTIPDTFMNECNLGLIDLSHNQLQGIIPRSLAYCKGLEFLDLGNNQINDTFPAWLGSLLELDILILKSNNFHGVISEPKIDCGFPNLKIIDLSNNSFIGKLPSKYFQCWNGMKFVNTSRLRYMHGFFPSDFLYGSFALYYYSLTVSNKGRMMTYYKIPDIIVGIILSSNNFDGEIPKSIANTKQLQILSLDNNNLHGNIPSCLGNLTELESLDLSNNKLSGQIPRQFVELTFLGFFNISHNNLTGPIPQGNQFSTFGNTSFSGNSGLCGMPLSKECENSEATTNEDDIPVSESLFSGLFDWKIILTGYSGGLIVGVVLGLSFSTNIAKWFLEKFGLRSKRMIRNRRRRN